MSIPPRRARASILAWTAALFVVAAASLGGLHPDSASASSAQTGCEGSYGWPVAPFDQQHPIRGAFGDPRTNFHAEPTLAGLMTGSGSFSFHQGVDIAAADGTAVYPVATGVVQKVKGEGVVVACDNGRAFEYEHVQPEVVVGQRVVAGQTILGPIIAPRWPRPPDAARPHELGQSARPERPDALQGHDRSPGRCPRTRPSGRSSHAAPTRTWRSSGSTTRSSSGALTSSSSRRSPSTRARSRMAYTTSSSRWATAPATRAHGRCV